MKKIGFPEGFKWGAATAAYQVEGAAFDDGKGPSIWDWFSSIPGKVERNETGVIACDQYRRYPEDIKLMRELALQVYRFSISWPRILPQGTGAINPKGLDHYDRLVDALLEAGIEPWVTLYHWDLPLALHERGGWPNRDITDWFADYAEIVAKKLGDRVKNWMTMNEPWVCCYGGYLNGWMAPGVRDPKQAFHSVYHFNLAHGKAYSAMKAIHPDLKIGITHATQQHRCLDDDPATRALADLMWEENNGVYLEPIFNGSFPQVMLDKFEGCFPEIREDDLKLMNQYDIVGLQYYTDMLLENGAWVQGRRPEFEYTEMGWAITPDGFYENIMEYVHRYSPKELAVTENGMALADEPTEAGEVHDPRRRKYFEQHLTSVHRAIQDGAPLTAYIAWSLMDNYEWACGYRPRFGLVYVDYLTQKRIIKDSARWLSEVFRNNGFEV
ncbi:GH1 family beta-glucosidase [Verrucomicrobiota bacterium]